MGLLSRRELVVQSLGAAVGCLLTKSAQTAEPQWTDRRADGPFQCVAAFPLASLEPCFAELARLGRELHRTLAIPPAQETIEIYLLTNQAAHRAYVSELYPKAPYRRALYVLRGRRGAVYAYQHPELAVDLRHECTHALLHASLPTVPLWLDEGLAEYFEVPESERPFDHPHLTATRWLARLGAVQSIESLEARHDLAEMGPLEYQNAWAWTHFMLHGPLTAHRTLVQYLAEIRAGKEPGSLGERLHAATPDIDRRMRQHFQHWQRATPGRQPLAMRSKA
jgi:hypothetical protein